MQDPSAKVAAVQDPSAKRAAVQCMMSAGLQEEPAPRKHIVADQMWSEVRNRSHETKDQRKIAEDFECACLREEPSSENY